MEVREERMAGGKDRGEENKREMDGWMDRKGGRDGGRDKVVVVEA